MTLYLISTPIGNIKDISLRAKEAIEASDYLLCEDTRTSGKLLSMIGLKRPLKSFHQFSEAKKEVGIIKDLKEGSTIGLMSDAGMPVICDPGERLVRRCRQEEIKVEVIPGPSALLVALCGSGWSATPFQFLGFLPKKSGALKRTLGEICNYSGTTIVYETKHRLEKVLKLISEEQPKMKIAIFRELTKVYEEYIEGDALTLLEHYKNKPPKGEFVLLLRYDED